MRSQVFAGAFDKRILFLDTGVAFSWKCIWCPADYISIIILQQFIIAIYLMNFSLYKHLFLDSSSTNHEIFRNFSYTLQAYQGSKMDSYPRGQNFLKFIFRQLTIWMCGESKIKICHYQSFCIIFN